MSKHCPEKLDKIGDLKSLEFHYCFTRLRWTSMNVIFAFMELYERKKLKVLAKKWSFFSSCRSALVCLRRTVEPVRKKLKIVIVSDSDSDDSQSSYLTQSESESSYSTQSDRTRLISELF